MRSKAKALKRYRKLGKQTYRGKGRLKGSGHRAGEEWGEKKEIDPESKITKYSKNSPSFDAGVRIHKVKSHNKALTEAKVDKFFNK